METCKLELGNISVESECGMRLKKVEEQTINAPGNLFNGRKREAAREIIDTFTEFHIYILYHVWLLRERLIYYLKLSQ